MYSSTLLLSTSFALLAIALAGPMGGMGAQKGHGGPPFLANATQEARQAFEKIFETQNQTKAQTKTAVDAWASTYGLTAELTAFTTQMDSMKTAQRANVTAAVGELNNALTQVYAVVDNENLTESEEHTQIKALFDTYSDELKELVGAAIGGGMKGGKGAEGGHGGMGGMGGGQGGRGGNGGNGGRQEGGHH